MGQPAYLRILQTLRDRIASGEWSVGDQLPTDEALTEIFRASRFTVRAALDVLVADGLIKRYRRRGTFVTARPEGAATWLMMSLDDLVVGAFPTPPIIQAIEEMPASAPVARALGLDDDGVVLRITVLRRDEADCPYACSVIHIPSELAAELPKDWRSRIPSQPFVEIIAAANALAVHKAIQVASAIAAPPGMATTLLVPEGVPLLLLERTFLTRDGIALEHAQIFCRPDRYRQIIEFRGSAARSQEER